LVGDHGVPQQINSYFTVVIIDAYLTNGNGVCWSADNIYESLIHNFTQSLFFLAVSSFTHDKISSKLQFPLCKKHYTLLLETAKANVASPALIKFIEDIQNYGQPLYKLKDDQKIIQQIDHLKKVLK
jgi:hypothetical protein